MPITQIIYASRPFGFDAALLAGILMDARRCNTRDGITGALICRDDLFLQLLEGPDEVVDAAFGRIARDDRHVEVRCLSRRTLGDDARLFPRWAMRDDPAKSWAWSRSEVDNGVLDHATQAEAVAIFEHLAKLA
jgi:hypothetical protein